MMAENELTSQLKDIIEQNKELPYENEEFMKALSQSQTALDGFDASGLESLKSLAMNLPNNSPFKEGILSRIEAKLQEAQTNTSSDARVKEDIEPELHSAPQPAEASIQSEFANFVTQPSYSVAARYKELGEKGETATPDELAEKEQLELMAREALKLSSPDVVSVENAVSLSDYVEIAEKSPNLSDEEKENIEKFKTEIAKALKEYDDLNDIKRFENLNPDEMDQNEAA